MVIAYFIHHLYIPILDGSAPYDLLDLVFYSLRTQPFNECAEISRADRKKERVGRTERWRTWWAAAGEESLWRTTLDLKCSFTKSSPQYLDAHDTPKIRPHPENNTCSPTPQCLWLSEIITPCSHAGVGYLQLCASKQCHFHGHLKSSASRLSKVTTVHVRTHTLIISDNSPAPLIGSLTLNGVFLHWVTHTTHSYQLIMKSQQAEKWNATVTRRLDRIVLCTFMIYDWLHV